MVDQATPVKAVSWVVPAEFAGARLDAFVRHWLPQLSRRALSDALDARLFLVDGRVGRKGDRLAAASHVVYAGPTVWLAQQPPPAAGLELPIIYEDGSILALNKPAGVATHGFSARDAGTLANWVAAERPELLNVGKNRWEPGLLHRLDVETSGLILLAKSHAAFDRLRAQFRRREISKTYLALVWGDTENDGVVELPLAHDRADQRKMRAAKRAGGTKQPRSWHAVTQYHRIGTAQGLTLLEVAMVTGVTHQIRVHLAAIGLPIIGDALYGAAEKENFGLARHFLHAKGLVFRHPDDQRPMALEAPLPMELIAVLERLGLVL
jgi:23S rRNA pseudouridine1911/1915/1917 synthase